MQEPGPIPPTDSQPSTTPGLPSRGGDPVVRWLMIAIFAVVILTLAGILSALAFGLFNTTGAPRTEVERDLDYYTAQVKSGKADSQTYAKYVDTLVSAGQLSKARQALDQALLIAKTDRSYLFAERAQLQFIDKQYQASVTSANQAMAEAEKELKAFMANNVTNNRRADAGATLPLSYSTAALTKANALVALHDYKGAVQAFDVYLKVSPTDSDILVLRAQAKAQAGDKTGAAADYRAALKYIPDYQPALDGLKQIGASK